jgi:hypothetical protein
MANYKNKQFPGTIEGFKDWCRTFDPLERGTKVRYYEWDGLYLCLEHIKGGTSYGAYSFIGLTLRRYSLDEQDFEWVSKSDLTGPERDWISAHVRQYEKLTGCKYGLDFDD